MLFAQYNYFSYPVSMYMYYKTTELIFLKKLAL